MPLIPGTWSIIAEGHEGTLQIMSVASTGHILFKLTIGGIGLVTTSETAVFEAGYWDESSQTITLHVTTYDPNVLNPPAKFLDSFLFEGYQFQTPAQPQPGQDVLWTLVGHVTTLGSAPGGLTPSARRHRFGWRATLTQTL
jgi:hypothetical protein